MKRIGIIGCGFVGKAVAHGFSLHAKVKMYDKYNDGYNTIEETVNSSQYIFICVPTPMNDDGAQDLSCINDAIKNVVRVANSEKTIIIKSTVLPGTTKKFATGVPGHDFVFNPEFLTERTADLDFINPTRIIIGGESIPAAMVNTLYLDRFPTTPIYMTTWEGAEIVKYLNNCFFAVKISFLNEMFDMAKNLNVPYDDLKNMWLADGRIGNSHVDVPGHDDSRGYGGKCYPKDVMALVKWAESQGLHADMCKTADSVNNRVRSDRDWEKIKGATSSNSYEKQ